MKIFHLIQDWIRLLSRPDSADEDVSPGVSHTQTLQQLGLDPAAKDRLAQQQGWPDSSDVRVLEKLGFETAAVPEVERGLWFHLLRVLVAGAVFLISVVCVAGAIWEGHSALFGERRITALVVLTLLLVILGIFEGLQISVALLRFKDIEYFDGRFPRAARLHHWFRTESGTRRFLAGRQFFVVFVVFFIARITSFPGLRHLPLTGIVLPDSLELLWFALFDLGLAGAFLVLWAAQLAPQFGANRDPLAFLDLPGMGPALHASFWVDETGVTLPGFWFSSWVPERSKIPNSRSERYRLAREEGIGAAANLVRYRISMGRGTTSRGTTGRRATVAVEKRFQLTKGGFDAFDDESVAVDSPSAEVADFEFLVARDGQTLRSASTVMAHHVDDSKAFTFQLSPETGPFEPGDRVSLTANLECGELSEHILTFGEPTRLVHVVLEFELDSERHSWDAWVQRSDSHLPEQGSKSPLSIGVDGDVVRAEYFCVFPRPGEVLRFSWSSGP